MKYFLFTTLLFSFSNAFSQTSGSLSCSDANPKAGLEYRYIYHPPADLIMPGKAQAIILCNGAEFSPNYVPLSKENGQYFFSFKSPDSTDALVIGIADEKKTVIDNNKGNGYVTYLYDKNGKQYSTSIVSSLSIINSIATYFLKLKTPRESLLAAYEDEYKKNPKLKNEKNYIDYLYILYSIKKEAAKPNLLSYAKKMEMVKADESKWTNAMNVYNLLKMNTEGKRLENKILKYFPTGQTAKNIFWKDVYNKDLSEKSLLLSMNKYFSVFKDSSENIRDNFYQLIVFGALKQPDINTLERYEALISKKTKLASIYNNYAWELCGDNPETPAKMADTAKLFSAKSLRIIEEALNNPTQESDKNELLQNWDMYADTYALLLYKEKKYDSAFYFQEKILKRGEMGTDGKERYAVYAEAAKGPQYAAHFIENEFQNGATSSVMINHLTELYKKLNLPEEQIALIKSKADSIRKEKARKRITDLFGTTKAKDFTLKNLNNETVSLSSLRNKTVILDFWATWCGPCRASFPATQQVINSYKNNPNVVFLFIDTWENTSFEKMKKNAAKFIADNKYTFEVLLDSENKVVEDYKVEGVPTTFIVDKNGDIVFMGHPSGNLALEIESARK